MPPDGASPPWRSSALLLLLRRGAACNTSPALSRLPRLTRGVAMSVVLSGRHMARTDESDGHRVHRRRARFR